MTNTIIASGAILLYLFVGMRLGIRLARAQESEGDKARLLGLGLAGSALHAWVLLQSLYTGAGFDFGFFSVLSLITWLIALLVLLSSFKQPMENLGIALLPLAAMALTLDVIFPSDHMLSRRAASMLEAHILTSLLAYSLLTVAAGQAVLLSIQESHLRARRPGGFIRTLPPMETMEALLFRIITIGFVLQSFSLITGFIFLKDMFAQHLVHKTVLSLVAWGVYAVLLIGHWRLGWRGRTAVRWTLSAFVVLVLAYLGSKLVQELVLQR